MKINIIDNGLHKHSNLLKKQLSKRINYEEDINGYVIELKFDNTIKDEDYSINSSDTGVTVCGGGDLGLYFGIGKLLHSAKWNSDSFMPVSTDGILSAACPFRAIYFAVHFYNWYQMSSDDELQNYLEELLLWGYNTVICILPIVNCDSANDPLMLESTDKLKKIFSISKQYAMKIGTIICVNQGFKTAPHELDAEISFDLQYRGCLGRNLCPSKKGTKEYMCALTKSVFSPFKELCLDYIITWPYDEGGCGCKDCVPWGGNGYANMILALKDTLLSIFPGAKFIVSTWAFDLPDDYGDYKSLYKRIETDLNWIEMLMVDSHLDFPEYVLNNLPNKPVVNFPEISMNGLFPWGGFGANPLPKHFQRLWDSVKHFVAGGLPYSEGLFEDISKIQCIGYYWNPENNYRDILSEYINYEYVPEVADTVFDIMEGIEVNHFNVAKHIEPDYELAHKISALAEEVQSILPERAKKSWRWRILYIRAKLDKKRYDAYKRDNIISTENGPEKLRCLSGDFIVNDPEAQELLKELQKYFCCVDFNGENHHTLPPVGGTKGITL